MGKGGVGKTTLAAALAVELASRGYPVHLTTSDPAGHLSETLDGALENLKVNQIDPASETERYRQHVLEIRGASLDAQGRALLEEDLHSPLLLQRASNELREIAAVATVHAKRYAVVPLPAEEPIGAGRLRKLAAVQPLASAEM